MIAQKQHYSSRCETSQYFSIKGPDRNIAKNREAWKNFVIDKKLGGVQLLADNNWNSEFIKVFGINSIPRFILIDPAGKVVNADAPRPSNPELQKLLAGLVK